MENVILPKELLSQVRRIEVRTRRMVDELTAGAYHSVFKGRGIEFDEVREYTEDDDVRDIDWNVTARTGSPHVKKYIEERELNVIFAVDGSSSTFYGSGERTKIIRAAEIAALLAFSAIRNHDRVGVLFFTDKTEFYLPPRSGKLHGMRVIREILARKYEHGRTNITSALDSLMNLLKKRSVIFLLSDLIDENDFSVKMRIVAKKHDLIVIRIYDKNEYSLPLIPEVEFEDAETGETGIIYANKNFRQKLANCIKDFHESKAKLCKKAGVDLIDIECSEDFIKPIMKFFRLREHRR